MEDEEGIKLEGKDSLLESNFDEIGDEKKKKKKKKIKFYLNMISII